jgi:hypothetical protein
MGEPTVAPYFIPTVEGTETLKMRVSAFDTLFSALPAEINLGQIEDADNAQDVSCNAIYYASLDQMQKVFQFTSTALDFQDMSSNNVQFYTTWPTNWHLNGCHAMVDAVFTDDIDEPVELVKMPQNLPKYSAGVPGVKSFSNLVIGDYMKYVSDVLFGTPYGVDLFTNGSEIYSNAVDQAQVKWVDLYNSYINVAMDLSSNDIYVGDASFNTELLMRTNAGLNELETDTNAFVTHYIMNETRTDDPTTGDAEEDTFPLCQQIFDALWSIENGVRFANIDPTELIDSSGNSFDITQTNPGDVDNLNRQRIAFPFIEGDFFCFKFTFEATDDANLSNPDIVSQDRSYMIYVKIDSTKVNTIPCQMADSPSNESVLLTTDFSEILLPSEAVEYRAFRLIRAEESEEVTLPEGGTAGPESNLLRADGVTTPLYPEYL